MRSEHQNAIGAKLMDLKKLRVEACAHNYIFHDFKASEIVMFRLHLKSLIFLCNFVLNVLLLDQSSVLNI